MRRRKKIRGGRKGGDEKMNGGDETKGYGREKKDRGRSNSRKAKIERSKRR